MTKLDDEGRIISFVMEPEEELVTLKFVHDHKPSRTLIVQPLQYPGETNSDCANRLGLTGGYYVGFFGGAEEPV